MHTILAHPKDEKFEKEFGHLPRMDDYIVDNKDLYPVVKEVMETGCGVHNQLQ